MMSVYYAGPALVVAGAAFLVLGIAYLIVRRTVNFYRDNHVDRDDPPYAQARAYKAKIVVALWAAEVVALGLAAMQTFYSTQAFTMIGFGILCVAVVVYRQWPDLQESSADARS